jgi:UDP-glucose 4-epimerase
MVKTFQQVNEVSVPYQITPRRPGDIATCYASPDKSREILGWSAQKDLADMCRDAWRWQSANPMGYRED